MKTRNLLPLAATLLFGTIPQATVAQTQAEMTDAACAKLKKADAELNRLYQQILAVKAKDVDFVTALKKAEAAWIAFRDAHLASIFPDPAPMAYGSAYPMCRCGVLEELTMLRAKELRRLWVDGVDEGDVCSGSCTVKSAKGNPRPKK